MKSYQDLAWIYLKKNKKRSLVTVIGVMLCVLLLFVFFSLVLSSILKSREEVRKECDYEVRFICDSREVGQELVKDPCIKSFDEKSVKLIGDEGKKLVYYEYVCFRNPYRMAKYADRLATKYGVSYELSPLAMYYFQDKQYDYVYTILVASILIAYIFAVIGVGIVRNSIQLISLEQMKDYGILRCMGATKRQIRSFIFRMGLIMELSGLLPGCLTGFGVFVCMAKTMELPIVFHWYVLPLIALVFLGDLYFVMQENSRFVNSLTPVSAVRGEFKIRKERIKQRKQSIFGKCFGIEGDYAYKSLMRSPQRFRKSVFSLSLGVAMVIIAYSGGKIAKNFIYGTSENWGYYQILGSLENENPYSFLEIGKGARVNSVISPEMDEEIRSLPYVTESKMLCGGEMLTADPKELSSHLLPAYLASFAGSYNVNSLYAQKIGKEENTPVQEASANVFAAQLVIVGYDEEDMKRLGKQLTAGTMELSENGIVLVNGSYCTRTSEFMGMERQETDYLEMTDYQVGDTIEVVDFREMSGIIRTRINALHKPYDQIELTERFMICYETYQSLVKNGKTKTYVIEGIVGIDPNYSQPDCGLHFVMPQERLQQETGNLGRDSGRVMYHIDRKKFMKTYPMTKDATMQIVDIEDTDLDTYYLELLSFAMGLRTTILYISLAVLFVVLMSTLNIINTTASNIYLRRREFAQLRVLGMSEKSLFMTAIGEGMITAFFSILFGLIGGLGVSYLLAVVCNVLFSVPFSFPYLGFLMGALACLGILCGSIYVSLKNLKVSMAADLTASGE